jgi:hypothetical protein
MVKTIIVPARIIEKPHIFMRNGQVLTPSSRRNGKSYINDYSTYIEKQKDGNKIGYLHFEDGLHLNNDLLSLQRTDDGDRWSWQFGEGVIFDGNVQAEERSFR